MGRMKDFVIEAQEQLWDEYMEEHPEATTADLERDIPYDMIYEKKKMVNGISGMSIGLKNTDHINQRKKLPLNVVSIFIIFR